MKLFMEVNPQLFDDCSHDYAEHQNQAAERKQNRQSRWDELGRIAEARKNGTLGTQTSSTANASGVGSPMRVDDNDPLSQDSQRRLEALRLQDDGLATRSRPQEFERQTSQTSVR